jgi:hypothetical protein
MDSETTSSNDCNQFNRGTIYLTYVTCGILEVAFIVLLSRVKISWCKSRIVMMTLLLMITNVSNPIWVKSSFAYYNLVCN